nr:MAG TPA: hypothetical protein [Caudoviricetes sp.]
MLNKEFFCFIFNIKKLNKRKYICLNLVLKS